MVLFKINQFFNLLFLDTSKISNETDLIEESNVASDRESDEESLYRNEKSLLKKSVTCHTKTPWTKPAERIVLERFPNLLDLASKVPSAKNIIELLKTTSNKELQDRSEPQVRAWMHHKRSLIQKNKGKDKKKERNTVPTYIYLDFEKYIQAKKEPPLKKYMNFIGSSPSYKHLTINNVENWIQEAINDNKETRKM